MIKNFGEMLAAAVVLRRFQDWRRGLDVRTFDQLGITNYEIGNALDCVLEMFGQDKPLTDCTDCRHNRENINQCGCARVLNGDECKFEKIGNE